MGILILFFLGNILPLCGWIWIAFCKYVRHFRKGCNNRKCWFRCKKCPPLHSEQLEMRIALLEQICPQNHAYITMLKNQLQMYRDNPALDCETKIKTIRRITQEIKEENG